MAFSTTKQQILINSPLLYVPSESELTNNHSTNTGCPIIWDSTNAKFTECSLPYLAIGPAAIVLLLVIGFVISPYIQSFRPSWLKPFIEEYPEKDETGASKHKSTLGWTIGLALLGLSGAIAQIVLIVLSPAQLPSIIQLASWTLISLLIVCYRPRTCPTSWFAFYATSLVLDAFSLVADTKRSHWITNFHYFSAFASVLSMIVILQMPFRPGSLSTQGISSVGSTPTIDDRSPEDNLRLWQFLTVSWMWPMISIGKKRTLDEADVWTLGFQFQHQRLHDRFRRIKGSVLGRVVKANATDFFIVSLTGILALILELSLPVLLQQLLLAMEHDTPLKRIIFTYALFSLFVRAASAQISVLSTWFGRRIYERSRGEMIMMVYEKALTRKNVVETKAEKPLQETEQNENGVDKNKDTPLPKWKTFLAPVLGLFQNKHLDAESKAKKHASTGKVMHLIRGDVYEVAQRFWEIDEFIKIPVGIVLSAALVWKFLGPSCFLGLLVLVFSQGLNYFLMRILLRWRRFRKIASDSRLQKSAQFIEVIRHLRWYGWQDHWLDQVQEARVHELSVRLKSTVVNMMIEFVNSLARGMFPVVALYAYTVLAGHQISIDVIFPALQLFQMLDSRLREVPQFITTLLNAYISVERIEAFMAEPERERDEDIFSEDLTLKLTHCDFAWPEQSTPILKDLNLTFEKGLTVICGKVGSGKTALLQSLLGEMDKLNGEKRVPREPMAYCAQSPWLQSMSIRDNILFFSPFDEARYRKVLDTCELVTDFASFKDGDLSNIGENGIGLSGGQKARVALARAVYNPGQILLLDDPLSALDHDTASSIVKKLFSGSLIEDRVVILVTHRTDLVKELADQIIDISDGQASVIGIKNLDTATNANATTDSSVTETEVDEPNTKDGTATPDKFMDDEHREKGGVKAHVYWTYIKAGGLPFWALAVALAVIWRFIFIVNTWFLKSWGESYGKKAAVSTRLWTLAHTSFNGEGIGISATDLHATDFKDILPSPEDNVVPWLWTFAAIAVAQSFLFLLYWCVEVTIILTAAKELFKQVMARVTYATYRFYDVTPVGRLMNRLTSDISTVDGKITAHFSRVALQSITLLSTIVVIASVQPVFLVFSVCLMSLFVWIFLQFLPTSQSLRRLETVSLSPLFANFGELLVGLTTVRAFHSGESFQQRVITVVDKFQAMDHFYWSLQSWLMYRFENLAALSTFSLTGLAIWTDLGPGLTAFVLSQSNLFVGSTHALCRRYGELQMEFVSVERVEELMHIDQEPPGTVDPPASWPAFGTDIVLDNVTVRYAQHLDPALQEINLRIPGGCTAAIVGRTGSGKSTLAQALLGIVRADVGEILIDNISVNDVNIQKLRHRVTFVAQDPVLFQGTIRHNLDPVSQFSDDECNAVLKRVCHRQEWTLTTHVESGGRNLSQGQRQLIGITRAVLRRSPIVIMDEATASIDFETSMEIQQVLREEMKESTVITIAHRVEAVKDADFVVMLEGGRVVKQGKTSEIGEASIQSAME
ncbi:ABC transporter [Microthyrium microscopicum]|uniref:ABC transporter n=1 Tax=Microthyrium microscopicum TaxID=703497 RepID=A0A6A6TW77_9PEZI|nr:ABC transporter [Microthyrium microscopicum]